MAYATGTATSPTNLLQSLVTFLVGAGWAQNMSQAEGSGWRAHLSKNGVFVNLRAFSNESMPGSGTGSAIAVYLGTGYNAGSAWNAQTGAPVQSGGSTVAFVGMALANTGPYLTYDLFADGDNVEVVLERAAGIFAHMGWGQVEKVGSGSWTGGAVFHSSTSAAYLNSSSVGVEGAGVTGGCPGAYGNNSNTAMAYVRADVDTFTGKWLSVAGTTVAGNGYTGKRGFSPVRGVNDPDSMIPGYGTNWQARQTSDMNGLANLLPVHVWAERDAGGASLLGHLPMVRFSNATARGFQIRQEEVHGSETWKFYPNFAVKKVV